MKISIFALMASALSVLASPPKAYSTQLKPPYCPPRPVMDWQRRIILNEFIQKFYVDLNFTAAYLDHVAEDYIQHNPFALSGRNNSLNALLSSGISRNSANFTVLRTGVDGNLAFAHVRMDVAGAPQPSVAIDILRFEGSCIQEHWDSVQTRPENPINPLALF
ncbi:hypothetical protein BKA56DRAFT_589695 [Ilyonectria sp. MPI-CAGE-AT-0026]|nr:hypothetical protein BKA56DRAFT_589695 [Ilyonectria sp. MPI-CAGE-AT-0026]